MTHRYATASGTHLVEIDDEPLTTILAICRSAQSIETGGILIGQYSGERTTATIREALGPPDGSRSSRTTFERGIYRLTKLLEERWPTGQHYVGEWHFHPYGTAQPSEQDVRQMTEISRDPAYDCATPVLIVVGGYGEGLHTLPWIVVEEAPVPLMKTGNDEPRSTGNE